MLRSESEKGKGASFITVAGGGHYVPETAASGPVLPGSWVEVWGVPLCGGGRVCLSGVLSGYFSFGLPPSTKSTGLPAQGVSCAHLCTNSLVCVYVCLSLLLF